MIRLSVKVTPKSSSGRIQGWEGEVLRIAVTAAPEDGKANKAVIALLAKTLKVPKSAIDIASGETSRHKTLLIDGDESLLAQLPSKDAS